MYCVSAFSIQSTQHILCRANRIMTQPWLGGSANTDTELIKVEWTKTGLGAVRHGTARACAACRSHRKSHLGSYGVPYRIPVDTRTSPGMLNWESKPFSVVLYFMQHHKPYLQCAPTLFVRRTGALKEREAFFFFFLGGVTFERVITKTIEASWGQRTSGSPRLVSHHTGCIMSGVSNGFHCKKKLFFF